MTIMLHPHNETTCSKREWESCTQDHKWSLGHMDNNQGRRSGMSCKVSQKHTFICLFIVAKETTGEGKKGRG